jgi:hypothetical protein
MAKPGTATTLVSLIGKSLPDRPLTGWVNGRSGLVGKGHLFVVWVQSERVAIFFAELESPLGGRPTRTVVDLSEVRLGVDELVVDRCSTESAIDEELIAVAKVVKNDETKESKPHRLVLMHAWRLNRARSRIEALPVAGLHCEDPWIDGGDGPSLK